MSTAQQILPLPSLEPAIFASLAVELGFVPTAPAHPLTPDEDAAGPVLALALLPVVDPAPSAGSEVTGDAEELNEVDEPVQDWTETESESGHDWAEPEGWSAQAWSDEEWSEDEPAAEEVEAVEAVEAVEPVVPVESPATLGHGLPAPRVPSMPPISRA